MLHDRPPAQHYLTPMVGQPSDPKPIAVSVPDLLDPRLRPPAGSVRLTMPTDPAGRLELLGGLDGVLLRMTADKASPDVKTFSLLLDALPPRREAESALLAAMTRHGVRPDADFCSLLIRRCSKRRDVAATQVGRRRNV